MAKLASDWRKPDGLFVVQPDGIDAFLLPLPVGRLPGVGKVTGEKLTKLGAQTVRDLRRKIQAIRAHAGEESMHATVARNLLGELSLELYDQVVSKYRRS